MLTTPLAVRGHRYLLKLDPPEHHHLVENDAAHRQGARALKIQVARYSVNQDRNGLGLLACRRRPSMASAPCTRLYGDETLALPVSGKTRHLRARHWAELAGSLGLRARSALAANRTALAAAAGIRLEELPFTGPRSTGP